MARSTEWWIETTIPSIFDPLSVPFPNQLATVAELADPTFEFAGRVMEVQRSFAEKVLAPLQGARDEPVAAGAMATA